MAADSSQTVVLTTSAPGVVWFALMTAGIEAHRAAIVTRPGAAIDAGDPSLARELAAALALTGSPQITVIGYAEDTVYELGARGLVDLVRETGADPDCFAQGRNAVLPGLERDVEATVRRTVRKLAAAAWLPPGLEVQGVVVRRDGSADTVTFAVVGEESVGETAEPAARRAPPPPEPDPYEPHPLRVPAGVEDGAPWPDEVRGMEGASDEAIAHEREFEQAARDLFGGDTAGPVAADVPRSGVPRSGVPAASGPAASGPVASGPVASGPVASGPVATTGSSLGELEAGPLTSGAATLGGSSLGGGSLGGTALGETSSGRSALGESAFGAASAGAFSLDGPSLLDGTSGALSTAGALDDVAGAAREPIPEPAAAPAPAAVPEREDDSIDRWFQAAAARPATGEDRPVASPEEGDLDARLTSSVQLLHHFLRSRSFQPPIDRDMRRLLSEGASPQAIMRHLQILVTQFTGDRSDVRAAFGTLEMAQAMLTRDDLLGLLRRILR